MEDDLKLLREILARELATINFYLGLQDTARSEEVRIFISHIVEEEKEHVAEAVSILGRFDPDQAKLLVTNHFAGGASEAGAPAGEFTVGSLRRTVKVRT